MKRVFGCPYFSYAAVLVAIFLGITGFNFWQQGEHGWMMTRQLLAIGLITMLGAFLSSRAIHAAVGRACSRLSRIMPDAPLLKDSGNDSAYGRVTEVPDSSWAPRRLVRLLQFSALPLKGLRIGAWNAMGAASGFVLPTAAVLFSIALLLPEHRLFVLVLALAESGAILSMNASWRRRLALPIVACLALSWALTSGLPYTHLADLLLNAGPSESLAIVAYLVAFFVVVGDAMAAKKSSADGGIRLIDIGLAFAIFAIAAFRTDHFNADWVPYHRSYFADTAQYVRDGHWLLWDVPSIYGFLSIATVAFFPSANAWQSLYILTGTLLTIEASIAFVMMRWGRCGSINLVFSILFPFATIMNDAIARFAWSGRLYPQGGMRFFGIVCLLFVAFLMYVNRVNVRRVNALRSAGTIFWSIGLFWSFENALWLSSLWLPYLFLDSLINRGKVRGIWEFVRFAVQRNWLVPVAPVVMFAVLETYYVIRLGNLPDWMAYVEYLGIFAHGVSPIIRVQAFGSGWTIMLALIATGAVLLSVLRAGRRELYPFAAAIWLSVWIGASYFAVEPLDEYVSLLLGVMVPALAAVFFLSSHAMRHDVTTSLARLSITPLAIITICIALGEPGRVLAMQFPFSSGWHADPSQGFATVPPELSKLLEKAGVAPGSAVIVPNRPFWTELSQGLILPFERSSDGTILEYHAWLPISPVGPQNAFSALPPWRQKEYIDRTLDSKGPLGWYVTYREPADCSSLSPRLRSTRAVRSTNFAVALCAQSTPE